MILKPPTTFQEQADILKEKNIYISDIANCIDFLSKTNYYRLSGYYLPFIDKNTKKCFNNIDFERIKQIYIFDTKLRSLISNAIETIEIYIRTQLSYYHAHSYGAEGYMKSSSFNKWHNHTSFTNHIQKCIQENADTSVIRHHTSLYNGHFPIWVIIEYFSIGMLSYFYRGMQNKDKAFIAKNLYNINYQTLDSWLRCLTDLRNRCAHYARLYYWIFTALPKMPSSEKYVPTRRLFAQIYMLKLMYPNSQQWNQDVLNPLIKLVGKYKSHISIKHLDFPYRWKSMLKR